MVAGGDGLAVVEDEAPLGVPAGRLLSRSTAPAILRFAGAKWRVPNGSRIFHGRAISSTSNARFVIAARTWLGPPTLASSQSRRAKPSKEMKRELQGILRPMHANLRA